MVSSFLKKWDHELNEIVCSCCFIRVFAQFLTYCSDVGGLTFNIRFFYPMMGSHTVPGFSAAMIATSVTFLSLTSWDALEQGTKPSFCKVPSGGEQNLLFFCLFLLHLKVTLCQFSQGVCEAEIPPRSITRRMRSESSVGSSHTKMSVILQLSCCF